MRSASFLWNHFAQQVSLQPLKYLPMIERSYARQPHALLSAFKLLWENRPGSATDQIGRSRQFSSLFLTVQYLPMLLLTRKSGFTPCSHRHLGSAQILCGRLSIFMAWRQTRDLKLIGATDRIMSRSYPKSPKSNISVLRKWDSDWRRSGSNRYSIKE